MLTLRRAAIAGVLLVSAGCGGGAFVPPVVPLSVSLSNTTIVVPPNGTIVSVPVTITAPTETATFSISGLPGGVTYNYKESESNPSGLLTLMATSLTKPGNYAATITVGSSGQTASLVFTLTVTPAIKPAAVR